MLRRTVMRAFGASDEADLPSGGRTRRGRPAIRWSLAVDRLFEDVLAILRRHVGQGVEGVREESPGGDSPRSEAPSGPPSGPAPAGSPTACLLSLDGPRTRLEGYEFVLEGPRGRISCVNTLRGFLRVREELRGGEAGAVDGAVGMERGQAFGRATGTGEEPITVELITVQVQGGAYRPVRKRLATPGRGGGAGRSSFRYTSPPELAADFRRFVLGDALSAEQSPEACAEAPARVSADASERASASPSDDASGGTPANPSGDDPTDYPKT